MMFDSRRRDSLIARYVGLLTEIASKEPSVQVLDRIENALRHRRKFSADRLHSMCRGVADDVKSEDNVDA